MENQSSTTNKLPVEVNHPKKPLPRDAYGEEQIQSWRPNVQDTQPEEQQKHTSLGWWWGRGGNRGWGHGGGEADDPLGS